MSVIRRWRQRRARRRLGREAKAQQIAESAFAIIREIAEPLVAEGLAELSWPTLKYPSGGNPALADPPSQCAALEPVREGAASVSVEPVGTSRINLAVGDPFPGGAVYEVETFDDGWEDELRFCLDAVIQGRYRERIRENRLGQVEEMIFDLQGDERKITRQDLSGSGYAEVGERRYVPYRS